MHSTIQTSNNALPLNAIVLILSSYSTYVQPRHSTYCTRALGSIRISSVHNHRSSCSGQHIQPCDWLVTINGVPGLSRGHLQWPHTAFAFSSASSPFQSSCLLHRFSVLHTEDNNPNPSNVIFASFCACGFVSVEQALESRD